MIGFINKFFKKATPKAQRQSPREITRVLGAGIWLYRRMNRYGCYDSSLINNNAVVANNYLLWCDLHDEKEIVSQITKGLTFRVMPEIKGWGSAHDHPQSWHRVEGWRIAASHGGLWSSDHENALRICDRLNGLSAKYARKG